MKEQKIPSYKYCCVPTCTNTTITAPNKIFFSVPRHQKVRTLWCKLMKREPFSSSQTNHHCCEDHFDLNEDMANYFRHKLVKCSPRLKPNVAPHKFECQKSGTSRKRRFVERKYSAGKQELVIIEEPITEVQAIEVLKNGQSNLKEKIIFREPRESMVGKVISGEELVQGVTESRSKSMSEIPLKYEFPLDDLNTIKKESDCEGEQDVPARVTNEWPEIDIEYVDVNNIKDEPAEICQTEVPYSSFHRNLEEGVFFLVSNLDGTVIKDKYLLDRVQLMAFSTDTIKSYEQD